MQKAAPVETSEGDADWDQSWRQVHGMIPLTHSKMHEMPTPAPEQPVLPRRSALVIEILAFVLIAFLVGSALLFNLTASRPVVSEAPAVSVPLPPKSAEPAAVVSLPALTVEQAPVAEAEPAPTATLPDVQPQAGSTVATQADTTVTTQADTTVKAPAEAETLPQPEPPVELTALPPADAPVAQGGAAAVPSAPEPPTPASPSAEATASLPLPPEDVQALIRRGDQLLATGDVVAARAAYERAAAGGNRGAAMGVAKTYDPIFLAQTGVRGLRGDPARAALWYGKAAAAGDRDAQQRLRRLRAQYPQ
jgi:hypothetical protein